MTESEGRLTTIPRSWSTAIVFFAWLVALSSAIGQWVLQARAVDGGALAEVMEPTDFTGAGVTVALATVGAVVVLRSTSARYGWIMLIAASIIGLIGFSAHYSVLGQDVELPFVSPAIWIQDQWMITHFAVFLLTALFPDGKVASARWQRPVRLLAAGWSVLIVVFAFTDREASNFFEDLDGYLEEVPSNATGLIPVPEEVISAVWVLLVLASVVVGFGSLISRWRHADLELRLQLKWVLYAFGFLLAVLAIDVTSQAFVAGEMDADLRLAINLLFAAAQVGLVIALGFGVLKFRLYDLDLVINRTIVYGILTVIVVVSYVGVVLGVGAVLPIQETVLALVVTAVVAIAFAPLRSMVQTSVNRLMFGQRDDPYAVLVKTGQLLARSGAPETALGQLAETIAVALKLPGVAIELEEEGGFREWASYGELDPSSNGVAVVPLRHQGDLVGRLLAAPRSHRDPLSPKDTALLEGIAHHAGAVVRSVHLTAALQRSRERLVMAQEEERRRIRHDLHDELGPSLASQTFQLDAALERIEDDPTAAKQLLLALKEQNKQLVADIRRLVYELRPPALDELGIAQALAIQTSQLDDTGRLQIDLQTSPDPLPELPAAVEVAAYRIAREAIINTVRHADARECQTTLEVTGSELTVTVEDDGIGIGQVRSSGVGLTSMRERTEELGGSFEVGATKPTGTRITATIPLVDASPSEEGSASHG